MKNTKLNTNGYSKLSKILHWVMAFLVMLMFMAVFGFEQAVTEQQNVEMLMGHSSIGSLITILLCIRLYNTFINKAPKPKHNLVNWQQTASSISHKLLYVLLVLVPLTGYLTANHHQLPVMAFGSINLSGSMEQYSAESFTLFKSFHQASIISLGLLLTLHIAAALFHKLVLKDTVLGSMWKSKKHKI